MVALLYVLGGHNKNEIPSAVSNNPPAVYRLQQSVCKWYEVHGLCVIVCRTVQAQHFPCSFHICSTVILSPRVLPSAGLVTIHWRQCCQSNSLVVLCHCVDMMHTALAGCLVLAAWLLGCTGRRKHESLPRFLHCTFCRILSSYNNMYKHLQTSQHLTLIVKLHY